MGRCMKSWRLTSVGIGYIQNNRRGRCDDYPELGFRFGCRSAELQLLVPTDIVILPPQCPSFRNLAFHAFVQPGFEKRLVCEQLLTSQEGPP